MPVAFTVAGLVVVLAVAVLALGRWGELPRSAPDRPALNLPPDGVLSSGDVAAVRFGVGLRGYRMDEVDELLDRVGADLAERDAHIQFLQRQFEVAGIDPYSDLRDAAPDGGPSGLEPPRAGEPGTAPA